MMGDARWRALLVVGARVNHRLIDSESALYLGKIDFQADDISA